MRAIIVDDEPDSVSLLHLTLMRHCPQVSHISTFTSPVAALAELKANPPGILFLDIEMPVMNGFELLEQLMPLSFPVVFVTAYNQYAVRAFRMNALDYLVKPVNAADLTEAVTRSTTQSPDAQQLDMAQRQLRGEPVKKIAIHTQAGIAFVTLDDILYAEASNNYTLLHMHAGKPFVVSKTLKDVESLLDQFHFMRTHRQFMINLNHVKAFNRNDLLLTMANGTELPVARTQKDKFLDSYNSL